MTLPDHKIIAVIPALDEEMTIGAVVFGAKHEAGEVLVVDDGSSDCTGRRAAGAGAFVIRHDRPVGYSAALEDGFREAFSRRHALIVVTMDGDGQHDPKDIPRLLAPLVRREADIALGERSSRTHVAEWLFSLYTRLHFNIRDPLCGLKAYRREVYEAVGHFDRLDSIGTELTLRAVRKGFRIVQVPITLHKRTDASRFYAKRVRANLKIFRAMLRIIARL